MRTSDAPRSPSRAWHPFCAGHKEGFIYGWDVAAQRGRGRPCGDRESQVFFGYFEVYYNISIFKDPFGHCYYQLALLYN